MEGDRLDAFLFPLIVYAEAPGIGAAEQGKRLLGRQGIDDLAILFLCECKKSFG